MGRICCGVSGYLPSCRIAVYRREYDEEGRMRICIAEGNMI